MSLRLLVTVRWLAVGASLALLGLACAPDQPPGEPMPDDAAMDEEGMDDDAMKGMDEMGQGADITVAAETRVSRLPPEPLGWVGYRVQGAGVQGPRRSWGPAFFYAEDEAVTVEIDDREIVLEPGGAVFVEEGVDHRVPDGSFWAFLLTDPGAEPPAGLEDTGRELSSGPLQGLPEKDADVRFLIVDLPPQGGQTTVHSHPGPEYIAVVEGDIEYETGLEETTMLTVGDDAALPRDTAVQKRNPSEDPARFWSWFIVDPDDPFAPEATFDRG